MFAKDLIFRKQNEQIYEIYLAMIISNSNATLQVPSLHPCWGIVKKIILFKRSGILEEICGAVRSW